MHKNETTTYDEVILNIVNDNYGFENRPVSLAVCFHHIMLLYSLDDNIKYEIRDSHNNKYISDEEMITIRKIYSLFDKSLVLTFNTTNLMKIFRYKKFKSNYVMFCHTPNKNEFDKIFLGVNCNILFLNKNTPMILINDERLVSLMKLTSDLHIYGVYDRNNDTVR